MAGLSPKAETESCIRAGPLLCATVVDILDWLKGHQRSFRGQYRLATVECLLPFGNGGDLENSLTRLLSKYRTERMTPNTSPILSWAFAPGP